MRLGSTCGRGRRPRYGDKLEKGVEEWRYAEDDSGISEPSVMTLTVPIVF